MTSPGNAALNLSQICGAKLGKGAAMTEAEQGDSAEMREWLDALDSVEAFEGMDRADELLEAVVTSARRKGARLPFAANTAYVNTIHPQDEPPHPGDREMEQAIRHAVRWNA